MNQITQIQAVIEIMKQKGGYATLLDLYREVPKVRNVNWNTKTPDASIRRIVQDSRHFFKIKAGLWALNDFKDKLPTDVSVLIENGRPGKENDINLHSFNQGLLINSGNLLGFKTYIPAQDKSRKYLDTPLEDLASLTTLPPFTYGTILSRIKSIDVIWLDGNNDNLFPSKIFEVENSTDFIKSLNKFNELRNFTLEMVIVAPDYKEKLFYDTLNWDIYKRLKNRVAFWDYDKLEQSYNQCIREKVNPMFF